MNYEAIIKGSIQDLTAVNLMAYDTYWSGYDFKTDIATLQSWGLSNKQIILGAFPYPTSGVGEILLLRYSSMPSMPKQMAWTCLFGISIMITTALQDPKMLAN